MTAMRAADWTSMTPSLSLLARDEIIYVLLCPSMLYRNLLYSCTVTSTVLLVKFFIRLWHGSTDFKRIGKVEEFIITAIILVSVPEKKNMLCGPLMITAI